MSALPTLPVLHLGALHGAEWVFVLLLALGPLLAAVAVVLAVRHRDDRPPTTPL